MLPQWAEAWRHWWLPTHAVKKRAQEITFSVVQPPLLLSWVADEVGLAFCHQLIGGKDCVTDRLVPVNTHIVSGTDWDHSLPCQFCCTCLNTNVWPQVVWEQFCLSCDSLALLVLKPEADMDRGCVRPCRIIADPCFQWFSHPSFAFWDGSALNTAQWDFGPSGICISLKHFHFCLACSSHPVGVS